MRDAPVGPRCVRAYVCMHASALTFTIFLSAGIPFVPLRNETALIVGSDVGNEGEKTTRKDRGAVGREKERVTNRGKVLACAVAASCRSIGDFKSGKMKGKKQ